MSNTPIPPTIPGSLDVDTISVNKVLDIVDRVVGDALSSLNTWKSSVRVATTANITLSGEQTIDGVAVVANDRVLVKNHATTTSKGVYLAQEGAWLRTDDMAEGSNAAGDAFYVTEGTTNGQKIFVCTNTIATGVVGTDNLTFTALTATTTTLTVPKATVTVASWAGGPAVINARSGLITITDADLTADTATTLVVTNSTVSADSIILIGVVTNGTLTPFIAEVSAISAGVNFTIRAMSPITSNNNGAAVLSFVIL